VYDVYHHYGFSLVLLLWCVNIIVVREASLAWSVERTRWSCCPWVCACVHLMCHNEPSLVCFLPYFSQGREAFCIVLCWRPPSNSYSWPLMGFVCGRGWVSRKKCPGFYRE